MSRAMSDAPDPSRRAMLAVLGGASCAAAIGVPVVVSVLAPAGMRSVVGATDFVPTVSLDAVPEDGAPVLVSIVVDRPRDAWKLLPRTEVGAVFLSRTPDGIRALSSICPHLGCQVEAELSRKVFRCPCHDSDFALDGATLTGPSPRGLDPLEARVQDGVVFVRYERFQTATADRIVV